MVQVTAAAASVLLAQKPEEQAVLRIAAVTEGCGCSADAMFEMIWDIPRPGDARYAVENGLEVVLDPGSQIFFAPEVIIDWEKEYGTFILKNRNEIFLNRIVL